MKKKFLALMAAATLSATALACFAACDDGKQTGEAGMGGAGVSLEAGARDAYGLGAVTTARLLAGSMAAEPAAASALAASGEAGAGSTQGGAENGAPLPQETVGTFNEYFQMLDIFLDESAFRTTVTENPDGALAYDYKLTVEGEQLDGSAVSYVMYYSEEQIALPPDDDDEIVEAYRITGVMEMEGVSYQMSGYRSVETEQERGETERSEEFWMRATHPEDAGAYVQMDLEAETEQEHGENESEQEYVYSVYRDGKLYERTTVAFEQEDEHGGRETEYSLGIYRGGETSYYEIERAERKNGAVTIQVNYRVGGARGSFVITQSADGAYTYRFGDVHYDFGDLDDLFGD